MSAKRAIVTGGSGFIGAAICQRLAADGMHVIVHANRNLTRADDIVSSIHRSGGSAQSIQFDITDAAATEHTLIELLLDGPVQVVVSNAGIHRDAPLAGMPVDIWKSVIDVSLNGFFNVTRPLLMPMMRTRWGRIIAISSISGLIGNRGQANYAAAKAGLHGAVKSVALELASRGITANAIAPGIIGEAADNESFDADSIDRLVPMKRAGRPDEVAGLVSYLASDQAGYITGQVIAISGGLA